MLSRFLDATEGTPPPAVVVHRWFPALPHALQESPSSIAPAAAEAEPLRAEILAALTRAIDREGAARVTPRADTQAALRRTVERHCVTLLDRMPPERLVGIDRQEFMASVLADAVGLGPLEPLLADRTVSEILVNGPAQVFAERGGRLTPAPEAVFRSAEHLLRIIERIVAPTGRRVDESTPMVDARLADGSRVNVVLTPIALEGPVLSIRRFPAERLTMADLLALGSVTPRIATRLTAMVRERKNCLIAGGTGTGKTTLLCILSADIPAEERIITIEDAAELQLQQPHVVRMEARPPNIEGAGAIAIRDLVRNALRMRPDRIVVGECRGAEALDMLQAMNTGHDGSLTTIHANSPKDALHRLETLVMFAGMDLPSHAIREQIVGAIQIVIQLARLPDGRRQVAQVVRVAGLRNGEILLEDAI
ncbi:MAG: CpaF family protein [Deltaproteobacteria bacterium]|nr:CpaF family protein [Deltaproteobacteria bacterium]